MQIRNECTYDGICTVFADNLVVTDLSPVAAEALKGALSKRTNLAGQPVDLVSEPGSGEAVKQKP